MLLLFPYCLIRVSFDVPIMEEDSDNNSLVDRTSNTNNHITRLSNNHTDKGYGMSGSAMGDSVLVSSLSQPDDDIEPSNRKKSSLWLQQFLKTNKSLHETEHSLRKDREFGQDPAIEAQYDRLAGRVEEMICPTPTPSPPLPTLISL